MFQSSASRGSRLVAPAAAVACTPLSRRKNSHSSATATFSSRKSGGASLASAVPAAPNSIQLQWADGVMGTFPNAWLRDHDPASYNTKTAQRDVDTVTVPLNLSAKSISVTNGKCSSSGVGGGHGSIDAAAADPSSVLTVEWDAPDGNPEHDGRVSSFHAQWLRDRLLTPPGHGSSTFGSTAVSAAGKGKRRQSDAGNPAASAQFPARTQPCSATATPAAPEIWGAELFTRDNGLSAAPTVAFEDVVNTSEGLELLLSHLVQYGLACVTSTPSTMAETERLARRIGFVQETLYGTLWATAPHLTPANPVDAHSANGGDAGAAELSSTAGGDAGVEEYSDTAYSNIELNLHTDGCYLTTPPGLQIFNCTWNTASGGDSRYVDGFAVASQLYDTDREAFEFFSEVSLPYHCFDSNVHQLAWGPVFSFKHRGFDRQYARGSNSADAGKHLAASLACVRHNDYDRAPLYAGLSASEVDTFYTHHKALTALIRDPANMLLLPNQVGNTMICNNHRVMHGRDAFNGDRNLMGCYIGKDEWESKARLMGVLAADAI